MLLISVPREQRQFYLCEIEQADQHSEFQVTSTCRETLSQKENDH